MNDLDVRCLAGELYHRGRIICRAAVARAGDDEAWADHCDEREQASTERISALLKRTDEPITMMAAARRFLEEA